MKYTLRHIEYFVTTAELGSITKATRQLNVSQPSISAAIAHLEDAFGFHLFIRHHAKGLSLTPDGRQFLGAAKRLLREAESLSNYATELVHEVSGKLSVGCILTIAPLIMPSIVASFTARFPLVQIDLHELDHSALIAGVAAGTLDLALTYGLIIPDELEYTRAAEFPPYAIVSSKHRLVARGSAHLRELADEPMVLLNLPHTREYFQAIFTQLGISPRIVHQTSSPSMVRSFVANGLGYSLLNAPLKNDRALDGTPFRRLQLNDDLPALDMGIITVRDSRHSRTASAFLEHLRKSMVF